MSRTPAGRAAQDRGTRYAAALAKSRDGAPVTRHPTRQRRAAQPARLTSRIRGITVQDRPPADAGPVPGVLRGCGARTADAAAPSGGPAVIAGPLRDRRQRMIEAFLLAGRRRRAGP